MVEAEATATSATTEAAEAEANAASAASELAEAEANAKVMEVNGHIDLEDDSVIEEIRKYFKDKVFNTIIPFIILLILGGIVSGILSNAIFSTP